MKKDKTDKINYPKYTEKKLIIRQPTKETHKELKLQTMT